MDEGDLQKCQQSAGKWKCPIETCKQILSRKQTLQQHLVALHNIIGSWKVHSYKQYEIDPSLPVPKSTQTWKRRRLHLTEGLTEFGNSSETSVQAENGPEETQAENELDDSSCNSQESSIITPNEQHCTLADSDMELCTSDEGNTDSSESEFDENFSSEEELAGPSGPKTSIEIDAPLYVIPPQSGLFESPITLKEHVLASCALMTRHNTSDTMLKHLLKYVGLHLPNTNIMEQNIDILKQMCGFEDSFMKFFVLCHVCKNVFPDKGTCPTPNCSGSKQDNSYFVIGDIKVQLRDILSRDGIWDSIQDTTTNSCLSNSVNDITSGTEYRKLKEKGNFLSDANNISLSLFTDGIPLFKSSGASLWPVYLLINELSSNQRFLRKNMILWGIWQGAGKPNMTTFLKPLVMDLISIHNEGVQIQLATEEKTITCKAMLVVATMDLQARAAVLHMTQHNGENACIYCMEPGEVVASGKGHCRSYPYRAFQLRSVDEIRIDGQQAQRQKRKVNGFTGESVLNFLPDFNLKDNIVIDYMHGILLGITKKLLTLWFNSESYNQPFFIGHKIRDIDSILMKITPPYVISRLPRKLSKTLHHWKASELRSWLLYYSIPCLKGTLPEVYLTHFSLLVEATTLLLGEGISQECLQRADMLLTKFVKNSALLYGENFVGLNVHNLLHLVPCVRKWGPLWAWSCFSFESFNGEIKKCVHGTGNVCKQIFWYLQAQKQIEKEATDSRDDPVRQFLREMTEGGGQDKGSGEKAYQCIAKGVADLTTELPANITVQLQQNNCDVSATSFSRVAKIVRNGYIFYSKACSKVRKRNSYTARTSTNSVVEIEYFLLQKLTKHVFAVCLELDIASEVLPGRLQHIRHAKYKSNDFCIAKAEDLQQLVVNFSVGREKYVSFIPNSVERD